MAEKINVFPSKAMIVFVDTFQIKLLKVWETQIY